VGARDLEGGARVSGNATLTFESRLGGRPGKITTIIDVEVLSPEGELSAEQIRELIVQVAIHLTNPDELDQLVGDLKACVNPIRVTRTKPKRLERVK
jgi:hypothetical protein